MERFTNLRVILAPKVGDASLSIWNEIGTIETTRLTNHVAQIEIETSGTQPMFYCVSIVIKQTKSILKFVTAI